MSHGGSSEARLRALLGETASPTSSASDAWADGYGIVAPDVERYVDVLHPLPDAVLLAMRNVAEAAALELLDPGAATVLALLARALRPAHVLEVGTGIGYVTTHLARAVPADCTVTSIDPDPLHQGQAHAFLAHEGIRCAVELRLGDPCEMLRDPAALGVDAPWELVVLTDPDLPRQQLVDLVVPRMAPDALLVLPAALRGGRVADTEASWHGRPEIELQRSLNRGIATDPRFTDVTLLPVGDGLLLARRRS